LGVEVVQLSAQVDGDKMSLLHGDLDKALKELTLITGVLGTNLGVRLDVGGEKVYLVDHKGIYVPEMAASAALATLLLRCNPGKIIVVPVHMPSVFEQIASRYGGRVVRCKMDLHDLTLVSAREGAILAADGAGNYVIPDFYPVIDGLIATAKLLECLAAQQTTLAEVVADLPPYHVDHREVSCPWESKGRVMRLLNQQYKERRAEMIDGVKILLGEGEWVLVLPDPDYPKFHVYAEARTDGEARELVDRYVRIVEGLQD
jgi:mannose-1-phosphate guanylyltransferase/phosphomannomutase